MRITITCEEDLISASEEVVARKLAYENRFDDNCVTISQIAKPYHMEPADLNSFLCDKKVQRKASGRYYLQPKYCGKGYAADRRRYYFTKDGRLKYTTTLVWTEKGREMIERMLKNNF
jgi:phage antirepressor YoqD-like protein